MREADLVTLIRSHASPLGGGIYIGAGLGTGPRDGVMTGLVARGFPLRTVRTKGSCSSG